MTTEPVIDSALEPEVLDPKTLAPEPPTPAMADVIEHFRIAQKCGGIIPIAGRPDAGCDRFLRLFLNNSAIVSLSVEVSEDPEIRARGHRPLFINLFRTSLLFHLDSSAGGSPASIAEFLMEKEVAAVGVLSADDWKDKGFRFLIELNEALGSEKYAGRVRPVLLFTAGSDWNKYLRTGNLPHLSFLPDIVPDSVDHERLIKEFKKHPSLAKLAEEMTLELAAAKAGQKDKSAELTPADGAAFSFQILAGTAREITYVHRLIELTPNFVGTIENGTVRDARMAMMKALLLLRPGLQRASAASSTSTSDSSSTAKRSEDMKACVGHSNRPIGRHGS